MRDTNQLMSDEFAEELLNLARLGRTSDFIETLEAMPTKGITDKNGNNPLHMAVLSDNLYLISYCLSHGFDAKQKNALGLTPAALASGSNISRKWACVELFLPYAHCKEDAEALGLNYALIYAVVADEYSLAKKLLDKGAKSDLWHGKDHNTCLHYAVINDNPDMIKLLMQHHADITRKNKAGQTPQRLAYILAKADYQDWDCHQTIRRAELEKRHGTGPDSSFKDIKKAFKSDLIDYCQSRFIYNWQWVRHHDRADTFLRKMLELDSTTKIIELLKFELHLFEENATEEKHAKQKYARLPNHRVKDGFNQLLEDYLELFERLEKHELCKKQYPEGKLLTNASSFTQFKPIKPNRDDVEIVDKEEKYSATATWSQKKS